MTREYEPDDGSLSAAQDPSNASPDAYCDTVAQQPEYQGELWYCINHNNDLVFATPEDATWTDQVRTALQAETWGEFRRLMPEDEYGRLLDEMYGYVEELTPVPSNRDHFDSYMISGVADGDYPPWLQASMDHDLPEEIVESYGVWQSSVFNGPYFSISADREFLVVRALQRLGYVVRRRDDLAFN